VMRVLSKKLCDIAPSIPAARATPPITIS